MPNFKHILFPVDFSDHCRAVLPFVTAMAQRFDARLTCLHVIETPIGWYGGMEGAYDAMFDFPAMTLEASRMLDKFLKPPEEAEKVIKHGDPATQITEYAGRHNVDLIMMPTHGAGKFRSLLLGSVTAKVLHDASCAIWTSAHHEDSHSPRHVECRTMLCAVDLGPESVPLIQAAADLAGQFKAKLCLVHAVSATESLPDKYLDSDFRRFLFESNREALVELQKQAGVSAEVCLEGGSVSATVSAAVRHHDADLVVIGRGKLHDPFGRLRTHAYAIIRDSPCPVLSL